MGSPLRVPQIVSRFIFHHYELVLDLVFLEKFARQGGDLEVDPVQAWSGGSTGLGRLNVDSSASEFLSDCPLLSSLHDHDCIAVGAVD